MTKNLPSARYTVFLSVCICVLVLTAIPASAIQRGTGGSGGNASAPQKRSVVEDLKQKWDNLDERTKDYAQEKIIDPVKGVAKDKAKQAVKKRWNRLKNSKTLGPAAKKLAKKYGPAAKKIARLAGPAGQIYSAYGTGQTVGEKLNTYVLDPLTSAYYDKQQEELTKKLEMEIAEHRKQVQLDRQVREMQERQEQQRRELEQASAELDRQQQVRNNPRTAAMPRPADGAQRAALSQRVDAESEATKRSRLEAVRRRAYNRFKAECDSRGGRVEEDENDREVYHCIAESEEPETTAEQTQVVTAETPQVAPPITRAQYTEHLRQTLRQAYEKWRRTSSERAEREIGAKWVAQQGGCKALGYLAPYAGKALEGHLGLDAKGKIGEFPRSALRFFWTVAYLGGCDQDTHGLGGMYSEECTICANDYGECEESLRRRPKGVVCFDTPSENVVVVYREERLPPWDPPPAINELLAGNQTSQARRSGAGSSPFSARRSGSPMW